MRFSKIDQSILIANTIDHFATSVYGFLVPIMAPLFFPKYKAITQLILAYGLLTTSIITRPLGALIFGLIAKYKGPIFSLSHSLVGVAFFTIGVGCIPVYESIGIGAPLLLIFVRLFLGIYAAGESTIAKIYITEHKSENQAFYASSWYEMTSILGVGIASLCAIYLPWRLCFFIGGSVGVWGYFLRNRQINPKDKRFEYLPFFIDIKQNKINILHIIITTGVSYITYALPFVVFNSLIPMITSISFSTMMKINTVLLFFDMAVFMVLGRFLLRFSAVQILITATFMLLLGAPFIGYLKDSSLLYLTSLRIWIVFWGVILAIPLKIYYRHLFSGSASQYMLIGLASSVGASCLGRTFPVLSLLLFSWLGLYAIGIYFGMILLLSLVLFYLRIK